MSNIFNFYQKGYHFPILKKLNIPVKVIVGEQDPYFHPSNIKNPLEAVEILKLTIKHCEVVLIKETKHRFLGKEDQVAAEVISCVSHQ